MFCRNCGNQMEEGTKFCVKCGASVAIDSAAQQQNQNNAVPVQANPQQVDPDSTVNSTVKGGFGGFIGPLQMEYANIPFLRKRSFLWGLWTVGVLINLGVSYIELPYMLVWVAFIIFIAIGVIGFSGDVYALRDGSVYKYKSPKWEWGTVGVGVALVWVYLLFF